MKFVYNADARLLPVSKSLLHTIEMIFSLLNSDHSSFSFKFAKSGFLFQHCLISAFEKPYILRRCVNVLTMSNLVPSGGVNTTFVFLMLIAMVADSLEKQYINNCMCSTPFATKLHYLHRIIKSQ